LPRWWLEETPHYTLDLDASAARKLAEEQMEHYYAQMAAADDAGLLDADGNPILGPDGKPVSGGWGGANGWAGRGPGGDVGFGPGEPGPLGRSFVPGQVTPESLKMLGFEESHPDYRSFLTGAKFPPGYWEKLTELGYSTGPGFSANNLAQTDYGRYGRQAEKPKHTPSWMKAKLKSTTHGSAIRSGHYEEIESPERRGRNRIAVNDVKENPILAISSPFLGGDDEPTSPSPAPVPTPAPAGPAAAGAGGAPKKKLIRKVRKVHRKKRPEEGGSSAEPHHQPVSYEKYSNKDYNQNGASNHHASAGKQVEQAPPKPQYQQQQPPQEEYEEEEYEEVTEHDIEDEEEVIEYTDHTEEEYEDEPGGGAADINDLQAILAAKQAELARLQAQLG